MAAATASAAACTGACQLSASAIPVASRIARQSTSVATPGRSTSAL
jgi:hypothetical protein